MKEFLLAIATLWIKVEEKLGRWLTFLFFPLVKIFAQSKIKSFGIELVDGYPKKPNQIGILKDEKQVFMNYGSNIISGSLDNHVEGLTTGDIPALLKSAKNFDLTITKDRTNWLAQHFNLQKGARAWKVAEHYDTGLYFS